MNLAVLWVNRICNMDCIETIELEGGLKLETFYDDCPECPREWDTFGTLYSNHRDYDFDDHTIDEILDDDGNLTIEDTHYYLNVYAYIHSGIALSTTREYPFNDRWDSGLFGIIAVSKEDAAKQFPEDTEAKAIAQLDAEINVLNEYCQGNCYGYILTDRYGDEIDTCWGYIGDYDDMVDEAKTIAKAEAESEAELEYITGKSVITVEVNWKAQKDKAEEIGEDGITAALETIVLEENPDMFRVNGVVVTGCTVV